MHNENIREVIIEYPESGALPCKVIYNKPTEGFEKRVLWRADNVEGFCEEKANELVTKLESLGWECYGEVTDDETVSDEAISENEAASDAETE
jgi:hypothetical protein